MGFIFSIFSFFTGSFAEHSAIIEGIENMYKAKARDAFFYKRGVLQKKDANFIKSDYNKKEKQFVLENSHIRFSDIQNIYIFFLTYIEFWFGCCISFKNNKMW